MSFTNKDKHNIYDALYQTEEQYRRTVINGHNIPGTIKGNNLKNEDVLYLDDLNKLLSINDQNKLSEEVESISKEKFKMVVEKYISDLDKAKRILKDSGDEGLAYEVNAVQNRLENRTRDILNLLL